MNKTDRWGVGVEIGGRDGGETKSVMEDGNKN